MTVARKTLLPATLIAGLAAGALVATSVAQHENAGGGEVGKTVTVKALRLQAAKPKAAIKNTVYHYTLPDITGVSAFTVSFPGLPKGQYLATYNVPAKMNTAGNFLICYFFRPSSPGQFLLQYGSVFNSYQAVSSSGAINTKPAKVRLQCNATGTITTTRPDGSFTSTVDFVRVDSIANRAAAQAAMRPTTPRGATGAR